MERKKIEVKDKLQAQKLIKVAAFDLSKHITKPHKHNGYLELVFLLSTSGKHFIDSREFIIRTPCVLVIRKDQVHHWELVNPVEGFVLLVKHQFVSQSLDFEINRLVDEITLFDTICFRDIGSMEQLLKLLAQEEDQICQEGLFKVILAKTLVNTKTSKQNKSYQDNIYVKFCALLNADQSVVNHVAHYASILNTSPQNLNAACKKNCNLTASEVIAGYIIKEAKRLLYYTSNSVSEVAFTLGFSDKSNFAKYFKRYTAMSPTEFKKMAS